MRHLILILLFLLYLCLSACKGQPNNSIEATPNASSDLSHADSLKETDHGIIYFSFDDGATWKNASSGLPQNIRIGLGGIAKSETQLAVATKEYGIYFYDFNDSSWVHVPTDKIILENNLGAMAFFKNTIYVGTQHKGVFYSKDKGKTWLPLNTELNNLTIRRFIEFESTLYVCTNDGFYSFNENLEKWQLEYGYNGLQVNGATYFKGSFYIATNKGIYKKQKDNEWTNILPAHSVHNISSDANELYAMTYTELLLSSKDDIHWESQQNGLPKDLYTFNVLAHNNIIFAGQWDGIYKKIKGNPSWVLSSEGLPTNFAVTNLKAFKEILVITTSERKLKEGSTIER